MKTESKLVSDYLSRSYSELQNMIRLADTKANIIVVLIGVVLSLFFNFFVSKNVLPLWQVMTVLILFFISGFYALITLYPRTAQKSGKLSLLYYIDTQDSVEKIVSGIINENREREILQDYIINIQAVSHIIDVKFKKLRISYIFFGLAILLKITFEMYVWLGV